MTKIVKTEATTVVTVENTNETLVKNEKLTLELKQELSQIFEYVAEFTNGLFEENGSIMNYAYGTELIANGKNGYEILDHYVIDHLEKVDTTELINYIDQTFIKDNIDDGFIELEVVIELSIIANYWFRKNGNIKFFSFVYSFIIENDSCGIQFAKELLLDNIDIQSIREEYPEYPMLNFTGVPKNVVKVFIPFSDMSKYFQESNYPHLNIGNEQIQAHLVYWDIDKIDEYCEMYPQFSNCIDYLDN